MFLFYVAYICDLTLSLLVDIISLSLSWASHKYTFITINIDVSVLCQLVDVCISKQFAPNFFRRAQGCKFLFSLPGAGFLVHLYQAGNASLQTHNTIITMAAQAL